ncbi:MAG: twin-arginine translocase subunit TatC [Burkholderiaceae bacterium]
MIEDGFTSHLLELRNRVIKSLSMVLIVFFSIVFWAPEIYTLFALPLIKVLPTGSTMIATDVAAPFFVPIKITMLVAFILALPYVIFQAWMFVSPGLYQGEKKLALPIILSSFLLFLVGMAFAYFVVFPAAFGFVSSYTPENVEMATDIDKYFNFAISLFFVFGLAFETPVVQMILVRMGVVTIESMIKFRPFFIVISFVIAAIVTPPDVISQLMLAVPLCLLFQLGIWLSVWFTKNGDEVK